MSVHYDIGEVAYCRALRGLVTVSQPLALRDAAEIKAGKRVSVGGKLRYVVIAVDGQEWAVTPAQIAKVDTKARLVDSWTDCVFVPAGLRAK